MSIAVRPVRNSSTITREEHGQNLRRYWTNACRTCALKAQCTTGPERRITRWEHEHVLEAVQERLDENPRSHAPARETVEHPFGTLKMRMGATHFLMKTLPKVATEMALCVLAYNLTRVMNIIGVQPLWRRSGRRSGRSPAPLRGQSDARQTLRRCMSDRLHRASAKNCSNRPRRDNCPVASPRTPRSALSHDQDPFSDIAHRFPLVNSGKRARCTLGTTAYGNRNARYHSCNPSRLSRTVIKVKTGRRGLG